MNKNYYEDGGFLGKEYFEMPEEKLIIVLESISLNGKKKGKLREISRIFSTFPNCTKKGIWEEIEKEILFALKIHKNKIIKHYNEGVNYPSINEGASYDGKNARVHYTKFEETKKNGNNKLRE